MGFHPTPRLLRFAPCPRDSAKKPPPARVVVLPAQPSTEDSPSFMGRFEHSMHVHHVKLYAMIGFRFTPDSSQTLRITIPEYASTDMYKSEIAKYLTESEAVVYGMTMEDVAALKEGLQINLDKYQVRSGTCDILCGGSSERAASVVAHQYLSNVLIRRIASLSDYTIGSITEVMTQASGMENFEQLQHRLSMSGLRQNGPVGPLSSD